MLCIYFSCFLFLVLISYLECYMLYYDQDIAILFHVFHVLLSQLRIGGSPADLVDLRIISLEQDKSQRSANKKQSKISKRYRIKVVQVQLKDLKVLHCGPQLPLPRQAHQISASHEIHQSKPNRFVDHIPPL